MNGNKGRGADEMRDTQESRRGHGLGCTYAVTGLLAVMLVGCSGQTDEPTRPESPPSADPSESNRARPFPEIDLADAGALRDNLDFLLPAGTHTVDVHQLSWPPRFYELTALFQRAMREHPEWFRQAVSNAPPGEPVPYDERLGMTREEYEEYLQLGRQVELPTVGQAELTILERADGTYELDGNQLIGLHDVVIDANRNEVDTPYGLCNVARAGEPQNDRALFPPGYRWSRDPAAVVATGTRVEFVLAYSSEDARVFINYRVNDSQNSGDRFDLFLSYPIGTTDYGTQTVKRRRE